jgi:hypothetical protein
MFGLGNFELWSMAIGFIVFGVLLIGVAVGILVAFVDWAAVKALRAKPNAEPQPKQ